MTRRRPFDAVILDCDGVLVDSERLVNDLEAGLLGQLGLRLTPDEARERFKGLTVGGVATAVEELLGTPLPAEWSYDWGMATALTFVRSLEPVEGVREVVAALVAQAMPLGVASQSPRPRIDLALALTGLAGFFGDRVFPAALVPRPKPAPDVYLLAACRLGADPARCAVVEDSPSGVAAAVAAGMSAFGYAADENRALLVEAGALPFDDMRELPALLDGARAGTPTGDPARFRDVYERFLRGDGAAIVGLLADDVVYHLPGRHLGGGTLRGVGAVMERLISAGRSCEAPPDVRLTGVAASGDLVLSTERFSARRGGRVLDQDVCVVWRMASGRCAEIWSQFSEQPACDRFWEGFE